MTERAGGSQGQTPKRDLSTVELKSITLDLKDQPLRYNQIDENEQCNSERKSLRSRELNPFGERDIDSSTSPKGEEVINFQLPPPVAEISNGRKSLQHQKSQSKTGNLFPSMPSIISNKSGRFSALNKDYFELPREGSAIQFVDEKQEPFQPASNSKIQERVSGQKSDGSFSNIPLEDDQNNFEVKRREILVIANPRSGSRKASKFIDRYANQIKPYQMRVESKDNLLRDCSVQVYDCTQQKELILERIKEALKERLNEQTEIILVTMGGDGMLGVFVDDISKDSYIAENMNHLIFVPLPYGTGNDISRSVGWGHREGPWGRDLDSLVSSLMKAEKDYFTIWDVNIYAKQVQGYARNELVTISEPFDDQSDLTHYKKSLGAYINMGLDSIISNAFEPHRTGNRHVNNMIYTYLTIKNLFCRCCDPINIKDMIESFTETKSGAKRLHGRTSDTESDNRQDDEEIKENVVFHTQDMQANPFAMVGVNIPSFYGGFQLTSWDRHKSLHLLPNHQTQLDVEKRHGKQSYGDHKIEFMGQDSRKSVIMKQMKRVCQMQDSISVNFKKDLPIGIPIYLSIDGENFVLHEPQKLVIETAKYSPINILRGPSPVPLELPSKKK